MLLGKGRYEESSLASVKSLNWFFSLYFKNVLNYLEASIVRNKLKKDRDALIIYNLTCFILLVCNNLNKLAML